MTKAAKTIAYLCRTFGSDPLLVQAGGGNTSVKIGAKEMIVKASGFRLADVTPTKGWVRVDQKRLRRGLSSLKEKKVSAKIEIAYADLLGKVADQKGPRVSMEAGFHSILPSRYVVHLHSVGGILAGLMPHKKTISFLSSVFGKSIPMCIVPPSIPGYELTFRVEQAAASNGIQLSKGVPIRLWILENHGIIWESSRPKAILKASATFEKTLRQSYRLERFSFPHERASTTCRSGRRVYQREAWREICFCHWSECDFDLEALFPDFAVYFNIWGDSGKDLVKTSTHSVAFEATSEKKFRDRAEVLFAHVLVSTLARRHRLYRPFSLSMVKTIKSLETERLRLAQVEKT